MRSSPFIRSSSQIPLLPVLLSTLLILCILLQAFLVTQLSSILDTASATGIFHRIQTPTSDELPFQTKQKHDNESHIFEPAINSTSPYAYVFLLAGCNTDSPLSYLGFLYTVMVSAEILKGRSHSRADLILMVQMDFNSPQSTLPHEQEAWLKSLGVQVQYIPPRRGNAFYHAQYLKFELLKFTQYQRIMYMDADVMPLCNLDYLFDESMSGRLQSNVLVAWWNEPASGGFFLLTPSKGEYEALRALIQEQERQVATQNDFTGWGTLQGDLPDVWRGTPSWPALGEDSPAVKGIVSNQWRWPGAFCDQGLLYYWTKYYEKDVSIFNLDTVEHWGQDEKGDLVRIKTEDNSILRERSCLPEGMDGEGHFGSSLHPMFVNKVPYRDFVHFTSSLKPWKSVTTEMLTDLMGRPPKSSTMFWISTLRDLEQRFDMPIDWKGLTEAQPPLGEYPKLTDMIRAGKQLLKTK